MSDDENTGESTGKAPEPPRPFLRIVRGDPTPEEIAALTVVMAAAGNGGEDVPAGPTSIWAAPDRRMRRPVRPGPNGWRASAWPG